MSSPSEELVAEPACVAHFREWSQSHGAWIHPALRFVADDTGMSVVASEHISADSPVLSCPFDLAIRPEQAASALKAAFGDLLDARFDQLSERQKMISYIIMHVVSEKYSRHLKHQPYFDTLPTGRTMTPLYFTKEEKLFLKGSNMLEAARERDSQWETEMDQARRTFFRVPGMNKAFTWARWLQAATWISSRAFPSSLLSSAKPSLSAVDSHPVLLPVIDCLNHKRNHAVTWKASTEPPSKAVPAVEGLDGGHVILVHHPEVLPGKQVYNNYGPKPNDELLLGYGFTLPHNPDDTMLLKIHGGHRHSIGRDPHTIVPLWKEVCHLLNQRRETEEEGDTNGMGKVYTDGIEKGKDKSRANEDSDEDIEDPEELQSTLDAIDALRNMVAMKVGALPNVAGQRPENIRPEVWRNIKHYIGGQKDILDSITDFCDAKEHRVIEAARQAGIELEVELAEGEE